MSQWGAEPDHRTERLSFFSDAVFAIAITLLVIEIHVPHIEPATVAGAWSALVGLLPSFFGFALSFLVIGRFWMGHHSALAKVSQFSPSIMWPNMLLLLAIAFMPFATAFMAQNIGQLVPTAFYNAHLLLTALLSWNVVRLASSLWPDHGDDPELSALRRQMLARGLGVALGSATALAATFASPIFSQFALLSIPLWQRLLARKVGL